MLYYSNILYYISFLGGVGKGWDVASVGNPTINTTNKLCPQGYSS